MKRKYVLLLTVFCLSTLAAVPAGAVTIGHIDTFEDGTTQNWIVGNAMGGSHPAPPENIASGGPSGPNDNFLLLHAIGGAGPGSKLSAFNLMQWSGNYPAAGVGGIRMWVKNFGPEDLSLRLLVADPGAGPPQNLAFSTTAVDVPAGGDWQRAFFSLNPVDMTVGVGSVGLALTGATELRIFHNDQPAFPFPPEGPPEVSADLGLDDIAAVPEPSSLTLTAIGIGLVLVCRGGRLAG